MKFVVIRLLKKYLLCWLLLITGISFRMPAQQTVVLDTTSKQHIFSYAEIEWFEDSAGVYTIAAVSSPAFDGHFQPNKTFIPNNYHFTSVNWFKIRIGYRHPPTNNVIIDL